MIIRRRHTANFTTIGNALFEDERLAADEVGILAFLLSKSDNWEVRRPALMRRWKIGRDSIRRVLRNLIRYGWIIAHTTRLSNGTVHIIYEVRDQPGPELSADEARAALSLVSSDAGPGEAADGDEPPDGTDERTDGADPPAGYGSPPTGQPGAASRLRQSPPGYKKDSEKPDLPRTESTKAVRAFSEVREAWPGDHVLSLVACEALHAGLNDDLKEAAFQGAKRYLDDCRAQNRKVCDLATYYRERRWERFLSKGPPADFYVVTRGTPQATRWREWLAANEPAKLVSFDLAMAGRGYTARTEWPPPKGPASASASTAPVAPLTNADIDEFTKV